MQYLNVSQSADSHKEVPENHQPWAVEIRNCPEHGGKGSHNEKANKIRSKPQKYYSCIVL